MSLNGRNWENGSVNGSVNGHGGFVLGPAESNGPAQAVILAGGKGTRLAPYTSVLPKPLMPIGDRAILEVVVEQLAASGFSNITFCVGYLSHLIRAVFDNRSTQGADISYVHEEEALGTAGPLRLVDHLHDTFLVMNGDVLTRLDYRDFVRHHMSSGNVLTIATRKRTVKVDYGVLYLDAEAQTQVQRYVEKPEIASTVSMGIYVLEPRALDYIPVGVHFDIPELVHALLRGRERIGAYAYDGLWFDIGRQDDYRQAVDAWTSNGDNPTQTVSVAT